MQSAFGEDGQPTDLAARASLDITLDDLAWWSAALQRAGADGELLPGKVRARMAAAPAAAR